MPARVARWSIAVLVEEVELVDELPRLDSGKMLKRKLFGDSYPEGTA